MKKLFSISVLAIIVMGCSITQFATQPTATPTETSTPQPTQTLTPTKTSTPTKTATPKPTLTPTLDFQKIGNDRITSYKNKDLDYLIEYFKYSYAVPLDDYTDDVARENMVFSTTMDFMPKEFMVISKIAYEHPTDRITKPNAGCGFIFHDNEIDKSYFAMITADSQARLFNLVLKEYIKGVAHHKIKQKPLTSPNGSAEVIVAVMDDRFVMAVDGEIVIDQAMTWDSEGKFGYSFSSGTNKGYGTRCIFTDTIIYTDDSAFPDSNPSS